MLSSSLLSGFLLFLYFIGTHGPKYTVECKKRRKLFSLFLRFFYFSTFFIAIYLYILCLLVIFSLYIYTLFELEQYISQYTVRSGPVQSDLDAMCVSVSALLYNDFTMRVLTTKTTTKDDRKKTKRNKYKYIYKF